ncbi:hypothetical protein ROA7450_01462 [Roseovarius albus]|uniref:Uncharacterized protein n=1 Tax=Roseovarius albus TaxID=1247867 RepID=A0A1X6YXK4_9RHOB|nr:hypothetical protein [Roseovarius albus]SLN32270.1 hypothetical protein ROA7450_01462 [Roseovarius albus]
MNDRKTVFYLCLLAFLSALPVAGLRAAENINILREDLKQIGPLGWIAPNITFPIGDLTSPWVTPTDETPSAVLVRRLQLKHGGRNPVVAYDNRDRAHSEVARNKFPSLPRLQYGPELQNANIDFGLAGQIIYPFPVIGNSSTAGTHWLTGRSQARLGMTGNGGPARAYLTYSNNHIYMYPEHRDHDGADMFPANWPYMVISQGSSGSDRPFLEAFFMTIAALPEETRKFLREQKLLAPTLQMILRRNLAGIYKREAYYTARAHPTVFSKEQLAPERMVAFAADLKLGDIPPMVRLKVEEESFNKLAGLGGMSEKLFDTPSAIARIWRGHQYRQDMVVSAVDTKDPNGRDLRFEWVVLRGDPERVKITLLDGPGTRARIEMQWQNMPLSVPQNDILSHRIDIGVFAFNGMHDSAPAFISVSFPTHQKRIYENSNASGRVLLTSVDYTNGQAPHFDPRLHWWADWRDEFEYDTDGELVGWRRMQPDGTTKIHAADAPPARYDFEKSQYGPRLVRRDTQ